MSEQGHKYTFAGFPGSYWEAKRLREAAEQRKRDAGAALRGEWPTLREALEELSEEREVL